jgi:hypothetical protein
VQQISDCVNQEKAANGHVAHGVQRAVHRRVPKTAANAPEMSVVG